VTTDRHEDDAVPRQNPIRVENGVVFHSTRAEQKGLIPDKGTQSEPAETDALFSLFRHAKNLRQFPDCSRNCSCQSTPEPQGSTGFGQYAVSLSIKSTYIHSISTGFNKRCDLFWEQMECPK